MAGRLAAGSGLVVALALTACTSVDLGKGTIMGVSAVQSIEGQRQGVVGPISWWAGDMQLITKENGDGAYDLYVFTLVLKNIGAGPVMITRMEWNVTDQDTIRGSPHFQSTSWPLAPQGERHFTWPYSLVCPSLYTCAPTQDAEPSWTFRFTGTTGQGQSLDVPISVTLPAQTLRTRFTW